MKKRYLYKGIGFNTKKLGYLELAIIRLVKNRRKVSDGLYLSSAYGISIIFDAENGRLFRFQTAKYKVKIQDGCIYMGKKLNKKSFQDGTLWSKVYNGEYFDFTGYKKVNCGSSYRGAGEYPYIQNRFRFPSGKIDLKIKVHIIMESIRSGLKVIDAIGYERKYEVHHIDCDVWNNRLSNLELLTIEEHKKRHQVLKKTKTKDIIDVTTNKREGLLKI